MTRTRCACRLRDGVACGQFWRAWLAVLPIRYTVEGLEQLDGAPRVADRRLPRAPVRVRHVHADRRAATTASATCRTASCIAASTDIPPLRWLGRRLGFADRRRCRLARGGRARRAHRSSRPAARARDAAASATATASSWGEGVGYVRLALKYGLPIVPVAAAGADDAYIGLDNADRARPASRACRTTGPGCRGSASDRSGLTRSRRPFRSACTRSSVRRSIPRGRRRRRPRRPRRPCCGAPARAARGAGPARPGRVDAHQGWAAS